MRPIDRRELLQAGLAAGACGLGLDLAVEASERNRSLAGLLDPSESPLPIKKALKIGMVRDGATILEKFQAIKAAGFAGVDMDSPNGLKRDDVLRARDETGVIIHGCVDSVHWKDTLGDADPAVVERGLKALRTALEDCKAYGGTTVLLVPAVVSAKISYQDAYSRSQSAIRKVLPDAERLGIKIAIENVWNNFLLSPLEMARYLDEFQSAWIGAYFDIGNVVKFGWPEQWIRVLGPRIIKLDVKEYGKEKLFNYPLGEGDIDWAAVRAALAEIKYEGFATAEMKGGDVAYLKDLAQRMDKSLGLKS